MEARVGFHEAFDFDVYLGLITFYIDIFQVSSMLPLQPTQLSQLCFDFFDFLHNFSGAEHESLIFIDRGIIFLLFAFPLEVFLELDLL